MYAPLIDHSVVSIVSVRMVMSYSIKKLSGSVAFTILSPSMFERSTLRDCCLSLRRLPALSWVRGFCLSFRGVVPDRGPLASVLQGDTEATPILNDSRWLLIP